MIIILDKIRIQLGQNILKNNLQNRVDKILNPVTSSSLPTKSLVTSSLPASEIEDSDLRVDVAV